MVTDALCLFSFVQNGSWGFATCQLVTIVVCGIFQFRKTNCRDFPQMLKDSWSAGLACNTLHRILLEEKTFEAPLSLFVQYFSAFYMAGDEFAFTSLWFSMALSTYGISTGLYLASHLTIVDLENEESDMKEDRDILSPSPRVLGQSAPLGIQPSPPQAVLPPPPGMGKPQTLPPPPGMGLGFFVPAGSKRPGQFASATE
eukprot:symbB.v1.2.005548.t1/scaffold258.1/size251559/2